MGGGILFLLALALLAGCSSKPRTARKGTEKPKKEVEVPDQTINLPNANSTQYSPDPKREPQWYVEWEQAKVDVAKEGAKNARMQGVSGYLYQEGKKGTTFRADGGLADKNDQVLMLQGNVKVVATDPKATLTCDRLVYDAKTKIIKALGHVQVAGEVGTIGTLSELWASRKLDVVATPDMFKLK